MKQPDPHNNCNWKHTQLVTQNRHRQTCPRCKAYSKAYTIRHWTLWRQDLYSDINACKVDRQQMVHITPPCCHHWHLSTYATVVPRYFPADTKSVFTVCSQEVTYCFPSQSAANCLPDRWTYRDPKRQKPVGPVLPNGLLIGYGTSLMPSTFLPSFYLFCWIVLYYNAAFMSTWNVQHCEREA